MAPSVNGHSLHKLLFGIDDIIGVRQSYSVRHAEHVRIHRKSRFSERIRQYNIRGLAPYSGQLGQFLHCIRHLTIVLFYQYAAQFNYIARLCVV